MRTINIRIKPVPALAAMMFLMIGVMSYQAVAIRNLQQQMLPPAVVATVDIEKVFNNCAMLTAMQTEITNLAKRYDSELEEMSKHIETLQNDLEAFPPQSEAYKKAEADLLIATFEYQGYTEFARQSLDVNRGRGKLQIYETIKAAARQLARENGWNIVVVNDSISMIDGKSEAEIEAQISGRRFLHVETEFDVSDLVIARLNR